MRVALVTDLQYTPQADEASNGVVSMPARKPWMIRNAGKIVPWTLAGALGLTLVATQVDWPRGSGDEPVAAAPATYDVAVAFQLVDYKTFKNDCVGTAGYSDIGPNTQVTIRSGDARVLGVGVLGPGLGAKGNAVTPEANCSWSLRINDVPTGEQFYSVEVGRRGGITKSEADLKANRYEFEVSLGGDN
jgi:hypothetical protein